MNDHRPTGMDVAPLAVRIPHAAQMIGIGRSKFYQLIRSGDIATIKVGRATVVAVQSLHEFIARNQAH
jgi:excisionase family DNA binding protein